MLLKKSKIIKNIERDKDSRGYILSIVDSDIKNVSIIFCNKGSLRSNHYHKEDFHYMYVLKGEIDYFYKKIDNDKINYINVKEKETIFTPKMEVHATFFPVDTQLIVSSKNSRDMETYEKDTVRVDFLSLENIEEMKLKYGNK